MKKRLECIVTGDVHGVFYRRFARETARPLGLTGTARNLPQGVEVVAEGEEEVLTCYLAGLYTHPAAKITAIETHWQDATGEFPDFRVL